MRRRRGGRQVGPFTPRTHTAYPTLTDTDLGDAPDAVFHPSTPTPPSSPRGSAQINNSLPHLSRTPTEADLTSPQASQVELPRLKLRKYDSGLWRFEADWFAETVRSAQAFLRANGQPNVPRSEIEALVRAEFMEARGRQPDLQSPEWLRTRCHVHTT